MAGHRAQAARKRRIDHERVMFIALDGALKTSASSGARVKKVSQKVSLTSKVRQDSATAKFRKSSIYKGFKRSAIDGNDQKTVSNPVPATIRGRSIAELADLFLPNQVPGSNRRC